MSSSSTWAFGYGAIFLLSALEFLGLPVPGGILVAVAGAQSTGEQQGLVSLVLAASMGATVGDIPWYLLGRLGSKRLLHLYCKFTLGSATCVVHTESFFHRFGILSLVFSKFVPGVRLFAPPMAGLTGYSLGGFLLLDWLGGVLWASSFVLASRTFGQDVFLDMSDQAIWVLNIAPIMLVIIVRLIKRGIRGPAEEVLLSSPESGSPAEPKHHVKESIV